MLEDPSWLDTAGRILIGAFFLYAATTNLTQARIKDHIDRLTYYRAPFPAALFWIGSAMSISCSLLVLSGWHAEIGVLGLIIFVILASGLLLRFWEAPDAARRGGMRLGLLNNVAILGGLLLLLQNVR